MVAIDKIGYNYPSIYLNDLINQTLAQKPHLDQNVSHEQAAMSHMNKQSSTDYSSKISPQQFGLDPNNPSLQFATKGGGFVQVFGPLKTPGNDKFFQDPNPVVIRQKTKPVTYVQKVSLAYYKPPPPPAPGPVIIKEVRPPQQPAPPPLFVRIQPPPPPQQPPLVIRENPPPRPKHVPTTVVTKMLPNMPAPPPRVIVRNAPNRETAAKIASAYTNGLNSN